MIEEFWKNCLDYAKERISAQSFNTWIHPINPLKLEDNVLVIQVPSQFFYEWIEEHYAVLIKEAISAISGQEMRLEYSIVKELSDWSQQVSLATENTKDKPNQQLDLQNKVFEKQLEKYNALVPKYTLNSYIEGDCNRLAKSAGQAVAERPGTTAFNPLMVYGSVGLGKTHLVQAIGNEIKKNDTAQKVIYIATNEFTNQFIDALRNNSLQTFISYYRDTDVLIIDDVQLLKDKEKTQEVFFNIFNYLHQMGKQIIMTSDCAPKDLKGLQERLVSRFKWGLTADIQVPTYETRVEIINQKLAEDGVKVREDVVEYIAHSVETNTRDLVGVMISLSAHASLMKKEIDLELAKNVLKNIVTEDDTEVGIDFIQKTVSEYFRVNTEDLKAKTRKREIVVARQVAMYFTKDFTTHSLKSIGSHFGGRDHSTVIHALQSVNDMMDVDKKFKKSIEDLKGKFKRRVI